MASFLPHRANARMHCLQFLFALLLSVLLLGIGETRAHEGHDHGAPAPAVPEITKPRVTVQTENYELVGVANGDALTIFLDRFSSNEPIGDARIEVVTGAGANLAAEARPDGTYRVKVSEIASAGRHELIFNVAHKDGDDLLAGTIVVPDEETGSIGTKSAPEPSARPSWAEPWWVAGLGLLAGLILGLMLGGRRRATTAALLSSLLMLPAFDVRAHEGHEPSPAPSGESFAGEAPQRLPDGSVFLPKASQRLMTVRTELAIETEASRAASLVGRIISDPNRSGIVQSIAGGRVSPPESGLPRLGQAVKAGDVLATVTPAVPLADQSTISERQWELEGAILLAEQKLSRLNRLGPGVALRSQIDDTELEIENLKKRVATLKETKVQPEILTAPISGIISANHVVAGQVVQGQDVLFQIVDPEALWVEALVFDQLDPGSITEASAVAPDDTVLRLKYVGRGKALKQQAVQLQFAIENPPHNVALGQPVRVIARREATLKGMLVPRDAVVRGTGGQMVIWQHVEPERFVARPVRIEPYDGEKVLITAGISANDRIVVHGAELLAQVR